MKTEDCFFVISFVIIIVGIGILGSSQLDNKLNGFKGSPFGDAKYNAGAQTIPGKLQFEFYDVGDMNYDYINFEIVK